MNGVKKYQLEIVAGRRKRKNRQLKSRTTYSTHRIPESDISLFCSWLGNAVIILDKTKIWSNKKPLKKFEEYKLFVERHGSVF